MPSAYYQEKKGFIYNWKKNNPEKEKPEIQPIPWDQNLAASPACEWSL